MSLWTLLIAAIYVGAAELGFTVAMGEQVTPVWPPTGIALAALVVFGLRAWPGVALGAFVANLTAPAPLAATVGIATGNTLEAVIGAWVLRETGFDPTLRRLRDVVALVGVAALSTMVSATIGVTSLCRSGAEPWDAFGALWSVWWIGDAMGDLVVAPVLLVWASRALPFGSRRLGEALALMGVVVTATVFIFVHSFGRELTGYPLHYLIFPLVIWAAMRFDQRGTTAVTFVAAALAIWGTVNGWGPFAAGSENERLVVLQLFMAVVALTGLFLGAAIRQQRDTAIERQALFVEEQRVRQEAEEAHRDLDDFFENAVVALHWVGPDGIILRANPAELRMLGYAREEYVGRPIADFHVDREVIDGILARLRRGEAVRGCAARLRHRDGSIRHVLIDSNAMWKDGRFAHSRGFTRDVTAQKHAEDERAALLAGEQEARAEAEAGQRRLAFLAEASAVLASSLDYATTLDHVARLAIPILADYCLIDVFEPDGTQRRLAVAHADPAKVPLVGKLQELGPTAYHKRRMAHVIATGEPATLPALDLERVVTQIQPAELRAVVRALAPRSFVMVPLRAHERTLGTMTFVFSDSGRHYRAPDVALARELAQPAAMAIENARLHEAERRAREEAERATALAQAAERRTAFLAEAGVLLASTLDYQATLAGVARLAVPSMADWCRVDVVNEADVLNAVALAGPDPTQEKLALEIDRRYRISEHSPHGPARVVRDARSELVSEVPDGFLAAMASDAQHVRFLAAFPLESYVCVPMVTRGRTVGAITLMAVGSGRRYGVDDLRLAEDLAHRAALAIDNARLYGSERQARAEAEEANRSKDEFLTTVSHELRTPLQAMLGWVGVLRRGHLTEAKRIRALDIIEQSGRAQAALISDLLDVSRIVTGRLRLDIRPVDLRTVATEAADTVRPAAEAKEVGLHLLFDPTVTPVPGDHDRLRQVVWNLLANAVRFTPGGGRVELRVERRLPEVCLTVTDTGEGIAPEFLPYVFDRFRQAESSTSARRKAGVGLGLAIVRHLVELHGGRVTVASPGPGKGTTFTILLPVASTVPTATEHDEEEERRGDGARKGHPDR